MYVCILKKKQIKYSKKTISVRQAVTKPGKIFFIHSMKPLNNSNYLNYVSTLFGHKYKTKENRLSYTTYENRNFSSV